MRPAAVEGSEEGGGGAAFFGGGAGLDDFFEGGEADGAEAEVGAFAVMREPGGDVGLVGPEVEGEEIGRHQALGIRHQGRALGGGGLGGEVGGEGVVYGREFVGEGLVVLFEGDEAGEEGAVGGGEGGEG